MNYFRINIIDTISGDAVVNISTGAVGDDSDNDIYKFLHMQLNYSITQSSNPGFIDIGIDLNTLDPDRLIQSGQEINVYAIADGSTSLQLIFAGWIRSIDRTCTIQGSYMRLNIDNVLGQLTILGSNTNYNSATQQYNTIMLNISANQVNTLNFLNTIATGSLLNDIPYNQQTTLTKSEQWFTFINGASVPRGASPLPDTLWALCQVNKPRDDVVREILFPYNRIMWQNPQGEYIIQPLFYDDKADSAWNVDLFGNGGNWLSWETSDHAGEMINRIDCQFAAILPLNQHGNPKYTDNNIYVSASPNPTYYPRMNQLISSGLFDTSILTTKALDSSLITDASLIDSLTQALGYPEVQTLLKENQVHLSPNDKNANTVPAIYSSNEMAINNMKAYTATIVYDYNNQTDESGFLDMPLAKIVDFTSQGLLEYDSMLCFSCSLNIDANSGATLLANFTPIGSIVGTYYYRY